MDYLILTSGVLATLATIGHFTMGNKMYVKPVMDSNADEIPKRVMLSVFHYMSVFLVLTSVILIAFSLGQNLVFENPSDVLKIIGFSYAGFAAAQLIVAFTTPIKMAVFKMFQWIFWILIAVFALLATF